MIGAQDDRLDVLSRPNSTLIEVSSNEYPPFLPRKRFAGERLWRW